MSVNFLKLHWMVKVKETGDIIECSDKEKYDKAPATNDFKPFEVMIGKEKLFPKLEKAISKNLKSKDYFTVELTSDEAYGKKNAKMIETIPLREFTKQKINPYPGTVLDFGGLQGKILYVGSGRVTVDFNHPLAGKGLIYEVKVVDEIKDPLKKAEVLLAPYKNAVKDMDVSIDGDKLIIKSKMDLEQSLADVISEIKENVKEIKDVSVEKKETAKKSRGPSSKTESASKKDSAKKTSAKKSESKKEKSDKKSEKKDSKSESSKKSGAKKE